MAQTLLYEKKLIGGILSGVIKPDAVDVTPADLTELGDVLSACREIERDALPVTPELLADRLASSDCFYTAKDFAVWRETAPSAAVAFEALSKVKAAALKGYLTNRLADILADDAKTGTGMLDDIKAAIAIADRQYRTNENNFMLMSEIVPKLEAVLQDFYKGVSYAVSSGFGLYDVMLLDGYAKGDLHIVAGFTGQGKSAFALNCARHQAEAGHFVGVVSREMSDVENAMRLQASKQQIPRWQFRRGIYESTYQELQQGFDYLRNLPMAFDVRTRDVETLSIQVRRMCEQYDMQILYVDYLQLLSSSRNASRAEEVAAVSRGLKLIAMENNIPVVALCQFNRSGVNADKFSLISHLKESSGIEQDASTISYIQVSQTDDPDVKIRPAKLEVLKNRNGQTFKPIDLDFHGETFTFTEAAYQR